MASYKAEITLSPSVKSHLTVFHTYERCL